MANIREYLAFDEPYWAINREERNYAALLYYALLSRDNLLRFLQYIGSTFPIVDDEVSAYVEYSYLRDLWMHHKHLSNDSKRKLITELLATEDVQQLGGASVLQWNQHFGVGTPVASSEHIQSPASWSMPKYEPNIESTHDFIATCKFKWAFRIKPDLVIHTSNGHAIVIEAKYASVEGTYPAASAEKKIFGQRGLQAVKQTELQEYMFRHLLGVEAHYLFVAKHPGHASPPYKTLLWHDVFSALDLDGVPTFVREWLRMLA